MDLLDQSGVARAAGSELFTAENLQQLPAEARYELIRGELCQMPNNSAEHGNKTARLSGPVIVFVEEHELGECFAAETRFTIEQSPDTTLGPDFAFIARDRLTGIPPRGYLALAPDLVIETRSPGDSRTEFSLKIARWLQAGTRLVWALDPASRTLTVHQTGEMPQTLYPTDTLPGGDVLPGFSLPLQRVFREVGSK